MTLKISLQEDDLNLISSYKSIMFFKIRLKSTNKLDYSIFFFNIFLNQELINNNCLSLFMNKK